MEYNNFQLDSIGKPSKPLSGTLLYRMKIKVKDYKNIIFLTGAGISVASGLNTYRGINSSKSNDDIAYLGHVDRLADDPLSLWNFYLPLKEQIIQSSFNAAHQFIAKIEDSLTPDQSCCVITQNVDGYHQKAGSKNVIELHGNLQRSRCTNPKCISQPFTDHNMYDAVPPCKECGSPLRPDIVLFGEQLPLDAEWKSKHTMRGCDLFVAVGTSGTVSPASNFVRSADFEGARTVLLNLEPMKHPNPYFKEEYLGEAVTLLPQIFEI